MPYMKRQSWYEDTTIVILGDHISINNTFYDDIGNYERTIYNCFINSLPDLSNESIAQNREYCTIDYFPTILAALGVDIEGNRGLGTNLFSGDRTLMEEMRYEKFAILFFGILYR